MILFLAATTAALASEPTPTEPMPTEPMPTEPMPLDPALPVHGDPVGLYATGWDLPPQRPEYLDGDSPEQRCPVQVVVDAAGAIQASAPACPETMRDAALEAMKGWRFAGDPGPDGTTLQVVYVLRYNGRIGSLSMYAEIDPGPDHPTAQGRPGLKVVLPAQPKKPVEGKLTGKLKRAGAEPGACTLRVRVGEGGSVLEHAVVDCPEALQADALTRVEKARWLPGREDGLPTEDVVEVVVPYQR